jgi:hypothetical protein
MHAVRPLTNLGVQIAPTLSSGMSDLEQAYMSVRLTSRFTAPRDTEIKTSFRRRARTGKPVLRHVNHEMPSRAFPS